MTKKKETLEITKEAVLEAAEECPEWKQGLKKLFPTVFEEEYCCEMMRFLIDEGYIYPLPPYSTYLAKPNTSCHLERHLDYCPWCGKSLQ